VRSEIGKDTFEFYLERYKDLELKDYAYPKAKQYLNFCRIFKGRKAPTWIVSSSFIPASNLEVLAIYRVI